MKNIQVIDGAENAVFDIFAIEDEDFSALFPLGQDVAFIEDVEERLGADKLASILDRLWLFRIRKIDVIGIHGILFFGLAEKKQYYPTRIDEEAINPDGTRLR